MTISMNKAFGTKASQLSLTLLLPFTLVACATSERDRDALEEEQEREGRQLDERQQEERNQEQRQQEERNREQRQLDQRQLEERNELQGQLNEDNQQNGDMMGRNQQDGDMMRNQQNGHMDERRTSTAGQYIDDTVITANVKAALAGDDLVKAYQVKVKTVKGVVQLSGFVSSDDVQSRADVVASAVEGVVSVENDLLIK